MNRENRMYDSVVEVNIRDLVDIFRQASIALIPFVEMVQIPWREPDTYDDWDDISSVLFNSIVYNTIREAYSTDIESKLEFPDYGYIYDSYDVMSYIALRSKYLENSIIHVFLCFCSVETPYDSIGYRSIDDCGRPINEEYKVIPYNEVDLMFCHRLTNGNIDRKYTLSTKP